MHGKEAAGASDGREALVNEQSFGVGTLVAAVAPQRLPRWMINQPLERLSALDNVLQFHSERSIVVKSLDVPMPLAPSRGGKASSAAFKSATWPWSTAFFRIESRAGQTDNLALLDP